MFLPWFSADRATVDVPDLSSAWQWFGILDIYLVATALAAVALALAPPDATGRWLGRLALVLGGLGLAAVMFRLVSPPDDALGGFEIEISRGPGAFVCLLALAALTAGALAAAAPGDVADAPQRPRPESGSPSSA